MSTPTATESAAPLLDRILTDGAPPADETGERILAGAIQQVEDFGVRRFTVDDLARRVGLSRVTIYRHFPARQRLIEAALLYELRRFLAELDAAVASCETLEERLVEGFVAALTILRGHRLLSRILRTEPELILPLLTVDGAAVLAASRDFIAGFIRRESAAGGPRFEPEQIEVMSEMLARAVLSFLLTPASALELETPAQLRRFAQRYLAPVLAMMAGDEREEG